MSDRTNATVPKAWVAVACIPDSPCAKRSLILTARQTHCLLTRSVTEPNRNAAMQTVDEDKHRRSVSDSVAVLAPNRGVGAKSVSGQALSRRGPRMRFASKPKTISRLRETVTGYV